MHTTKARRRAVPSTQAGQQRARQAAPGPATLPRRRTGATKSHYKMQNKYLITYTETYSYPSVQGQVGRTGRAGQECATPSMPQGTARVPHSLPVHCWPLPPRSEISLMITARSSLNWSSSAGGAHRSWGSPLLQPLRQRFMGALWGAECRPGRGDVGAAPPCFRGILRASCMVW